MNFLQGQQKQFDLSNFDRSSWELSDWRDQKTRHILEHIGKSQLKLVGANSLVIKTEVVPDLAIYRTQVMNLFAMDSHDVEPAREVRPFNLVSQAYPGIMTAAGELGYYLEPLEHSPDNPDYTHAINAAVALHVTAMGLAGMYGLDLEEVHRMRLAMLSQTEV